MAFVRCRNCSRVIHGDSLKVKDALFHPDCFRCSACRKCLAGTGYYQKDDLYYCRKDFKKLFLKICHGCGSLIAGDMVSVLDKYFHQKCFYCKSCRVNFMPGVRVTYWKEDFFCSNCFTKIKNANLKLETKLSEGDSITGIKRNVQNEYNAAYKEEQAISSNLFEGDGPREKSVAFNLSNQVSDDSCSDFCKELAKRLAVQYLQCENHISDGTNRRTEEESTKQVSIDSVTTDQPLRESSSHSDYSTASNLLAEASVIRRKKVTNQSTHAEKSDGRVAYANQTSCSEQPAKEIESNRPLRTTKRSYVNFPRTGKVAALVKLLEGAPIQQCGMEKTQDGEDNLPLFLKLNKRNHIIEELRTRDEATSSTRMPADKKTDFRQKGSELKPLCWLPYEKSENKGKKTYFNEKVRSNSVDQGLSKCSTHNLLTQNNTSLGYTAKRKSWPPVMLGMNTVERSPISSDSTSYSKATQRPGLDFSFDACLSCTSVDCANLQPEVPPAETHQSPTIFMNEQNQSDLVEGIRQRSDNFKARVDSCNGDTASNEKNSIHSTSCQYQCSFNDDDQKMMSAQNGSKFRGIITPVRRRKWILCRRNKKISVRNVTATVSKMMKNLKIKTDPPNENGQNNTKNDALVLPYRKLAWTLVQLLVAGIVAIALIAVNVWIAGYPSQSAAKPTTSGSFTPDTTVNSVMNTQS